MTEGSNIPPDADNIPADTGRNKNTNILPETTAFRYGSHAMIKLLSCVKLEKYRNENNDDVCLT